MSKINFKTLGVKEPILATLGQLGYESPFPIQEKAIPSLLAGQDLLAEAKTGTGKTAAFALPILCHIDLNTHAPQALILAPTRELALQVTQNFKEYAKNLPGLKVLPIYGGASYTEQLRALKKGVHIVVGTPGRIIDHLKRGTLSLSKIKTLILDEADQMLQMGFIDDVEHIIQQIPHKAQTGLFSATMPKPIRDITHKYLSNAHHIKIKSQTATVNTITQQYMLINKHQKLAALNRYFALEDIDAAIIFTRTKLASNDLATRLKIPNKKIAAINGDMGQAQREEVIRKLKAKNLDVVVATDVAARGLDVDRISHVINYDISNDPESYVHRIGRTGRAGRSGKALLLISPNEHYLLKRLERATSQMLEKITPPSTLAIREKHDRSFLKDIHDKLTQSDLSPYKKLINAFIASNNYKAIEIAAALAAIAQTDQIPQEEITALDKPTHLKRNTAKRQDKKRFSKKSPQPRKERHKPQHNKKNFKARQKKRELPQG